MRHVKKRKPIWGAWCNAFGLWHLQPQLCKWNYDAQSWWHKDYDVQKTGLFLRDSYACFASYSKAEVSAWISGVRTSASMLSMFTKSKHPNNGGSK